MPRLIGSQASRGQLNSASDEPLKKRVEDYLERISKWVPAEIVAAFLTIRALVPVHGTEAAWPVALEISVYVALVILTPIYLWVFGGDVPRKHLQVAIATVSFVVWSYGVGGPFFFKALESATGARIEYPSLGGVIVILWTLAVGLKKPVAT